MAAPWSAMEVTQPYPSGLLKPGEKLLSTIKKNPTDTRGLSYLNDRNGLRSKGVLKIASFVYFWLAQG